MGKPKPAESSKGKPMGFSNLTLRRFRAHFQWPLGGISSPSQFLWTKQGDLTARHSHQGTDDHRNWSGWPCTESSPPTKRRRAMSSGVPLDAPGICWISPSPNLGEVVYCSIAFGSFQEKRWLSSYYFCFLTEPKRRDKQYLDELSVFKSLRLETARVHLRQHISSGMAFSGIAGRSKLKKMMKSCFSFAGSPCLWQKQHNHFVLSNSMQIVLQRILDDPKLEYALILEDVPRLSLFRMPSLNCWTLYLYCHW